MLEGFLLSNESLMTLDGFRLSNVSFMKLERLLLKYFVPLSIDFVSVSRTNFFDSFSFETIDSCLFSSSTKVALDPFAEEGALFFDRFLTQKLSKLAWLRLKVPLLDCPRVKLLLLGCFRMLPLESLAVALLSTWPLSSDLRSYQSKNNNQSPHCSVPAPARRQRSFCSRRALSRTCCTWWAGRSPWSSVQNDPLHRWRSLNVEIPEYCLNKCLSHIVQQWEVLEIISFVGKDFSSSSRMISHHSRLPR